MTLDAAAFATAAEQKSAVDELMDGLREEYDSFFQPLRPELYDPNVSFADPLISFSGLEKYKGNVDMLAGNTPFGNLCFSDSGLIMHNVQETPTGQSRLFDPVAVVEGVDW